jgi:hypothetical protein
MNYQLANLSTDLKRVSKWICVGQKSLVKDYLAKIKSKYQIAGQVGPYRDIWREIARIKSEKDKVEAADRVGTLSSILLQESFKS